MNTKNPAVFKGTRVPISIVVDYILKGWDRKEIKKAFPTMDMHNIDLCIAVVEAVTKLQTTYDTKTKN